MAKCNTTQMMILSRLERVLEDPTMGMAFKLEKTRVLVNTFLHTFKVLNKKWQQKSLDPNHWDS
jgi:hypothetical protein